MCAVKYYLAKKQKTTTTTKTTCKDTEDSHKPNAK